MMEIIICRECKDEKHPSGFYPSRTSKSERESICIECRRNKYEPNRRYRKAPPSLQKDNDLIRNIKLMTLSNSVVMEIVADAVVLEGITKQQKRQRIPFMEWSDLMKTKLFTPTQNKFI